MDKKRLLSSILSCSMALSLATPALASGNGTSDVTLKVDTGEEPSVVQVKVPSEIPISQDKDGVVTVADNLAIQNLSTDKAVDITAIQVTGKSGWEIIDYGTDISGEAEGTKKLGLEFRGDGTTSSGAVSLSPDNWSIDKEQSLQLNVNAKLPKQGADYETKQSIAQVDYTIEVHEGQVTPPPVEEGAITNNWDSSTKMLPTGSKPVTFSWDSTDADATITSVESSNPGVATIAKSPASGFAEMPYNGTENWVVTAVGRGTTTITATLSSGETTNFEVGVYELTSGGSGSGDIEVTVPGDGYTEGDDLGDSDITIEIPVTGPDGGSTVIEVTPEIPDGTELQPGDNNIEVDVDVNGVTLHITITINVASSNPSDGLTQTVEEAQAMGFTFSSYEDGLQIDSFENKQFKSEINVPEQIGDFKVLKIGDNVFKGQSNLTKITLPNTIKVIGNSAFSGCTGLVSLNIPDIVNAIGGYAFEDVKLDQLSIPSEDILKNTFGVLNGFTGKVYVKTNFVDTPYLLSSNTCGSIRDVVLKGGTVILKSDSSELEVKKEYIGTDHGGESYLFQDKNFNFSYSLFDKIPENVGKFYVPYYANGTRIDRYLQLGAIYLDSIPHNKGSYPILSKDLPYTFRLAYDFKGDGDYVTEIYCDFDFTDQDSSQNIGRDIYNAVIHFDDKSMYNGVEIDDSWKIVDFYDIVLKYTWNRSPSGDIKYVTHKFTGVNDGYDIHNLYVGGSDGHGIVFSDLIRNTTGSTTAKLKGSKSKPGQYSGLLYCDFENKIISSTTWNSYGGSELIGNGWQ